VFSCLDFFEKNLAFEGFKSPNLVNRGKNCPVKKHPSQTKEKKIRRSLFYYRGFGHLSDNFQKKISYFNPSII
jgi:hypothetical protein